MASVFIYLLVEILNSTYKGLSLSKNPFGKLVQIVSDDVRSFASMRMRFSVEAEAREALVLGWYLVLNY